MKYILKLHIHQQLEHVKPTKHIIQVHPRINIGLQYIRNISEIHFEVTYTSTNSA